MKRPQRILVAPLNWGLGHATRCIPIIRELQTLGAVVFLAADGNALSLLKKEFPQLPAFPLPAYNIHYQSQNMLWNMAWQWPKILRAVYLEHQRVKSLVSQHKIDVIVSDNRYGCHHPATHNIFLSHQLNIKTPLPWLDPLVSGINAFLARSFAEIWVPDVAESLNLSGDLSHPARFEKVTYLGLLSRMKWEQKEIKYDLVIVLSGPEPQRSLLENKIRAQIVKLPCKKILLIQGLTHLDHHTTEDNLEVVSYLTSKDLNEVLLSAKMIVCRSGYSSLMDLAVLQKPALLIPTPGQTEQEYLSQHLSALGLFYSVVQNELNLLSDLDMAKDFTGFSKNFFASSRLKQVLSELVLSEKSV